MNSKYAIVTICNDSYIDYCSTMIYSFIKNNDWFTGDIIICCDPEFVILSEENRNKLKSLYGNIIMREVNKSDYDSLFNNFKNKDKKFFPSAYTYEVFEIEGYDSILYLDADMLIIDDIKELFEKPVKIGVVSLTLENYKQWEINRLGLYNLGLILVNHQNIEDTKSIKTTLIRQGSKVNPRNVTLFEQGVFNKFLPIGVTQLSNIYNYFDIFDPKEGVKIVHFVSNKPLSSNKDGKYFKLWHDYHENCH